MAFRNSVFQWFSVRYTRRYIFNNLAIDQYDKLCILLFTRIIYTGCVAEMSS